MVKLFSFIFFFSISIAGCGTTVSEKESIIPKAEYTMKDIFDNKGIPSERAVSLQNVKTVVRRQATESELLISSYNVNGINEKPTFKKLPNPTLYLYFAPKLTSDGRMPVPAWMTEFPMYDRDEYALPGELNLGDRQ
ncbi:TIGR03751 family conjugal transfer lipoprotein [Vibrio metoecus]